MPSISLRSSEARESILKSARKEIERNGILGLRVADVANGANCSITQIYRYFTDRDGLLAQVLGDMYDELLGTTGSAYRAIIFRHETLTVDDLVNALPNFFDGSAKSNQNMRLQILAASVTNQPLRDRLSETTRRVAREWEEGCDEVERRLAPGEKFDRRIFSMFLANLLPYYRMLMGDEGFTHQEFTQFLRDKLSS